MALDEGSEEVVARATALYKKLYKTRKRPLKPKGKAVEELWGELRSLCQGDVTGGEIWSAWRPFFKAFPEDQREALCHYVQEAWGYPVRHFDDVEQAFLWHVLCANIQAMHAAGLPAMKPPLGEQKMQVCERAWGVELPEPLRHFVVNVSAGKSLEYETGIFDFEERAQSRETWMFARFLERSVAEDLSNDVDYWSKKPWVCDRLAGALAYFASHPERDVCDAEQARADGAAFMEDAMTSLIIGWFFEGNHGDYTQLMIMQGPLRGTMIEYNSLEHSGPDGAEISFGRPHMAGWLREIYHLQCLGEEIWGDLPIGIDF